LQGRSKEYKALSFELIESLSSVPIQKIKCWNFSAAIDQNNSLYVWGTLYDTNESKELCIKLPELISNIHIENIEIGSSIAVAIEKNTKRAHVLGINS
jgi:hypothetical protein